MHLYIYKKKKKKSSYKLSIHTILEPSLIIIMLQQTSMQEFKSPNTQYLQYKSETSPNTFARNKINMMQNLLINRIKSPLYLQHNDSKKTTDELMLTWVCAISEQQTQPYEDQLICDTNKITISASIQCNLSFSFLPSSDPLLRQFVYSYLW